MLGYPNNYFFTPIFDFVDLVPYSTTQFFFKALRRKKNLIIVYLFIYLFIAFFLGHHCLCLWRPSLYMFMAAFVLSVYVYLRRKEGCLAQASFVGVLRAKPEKSRRIACLSLWPSFFVYGLFMASLACLSTKRRASSFGHHGRHGHHGYLDTNQQNF